jgi:adenosylhomocysteine nucleosidase
MRTAIVSAMAQELRGLRDHLEQPRSESHAGREFWTGRLGDEQVVLALSRIGKVAAATTAAVLLTEFRVDRIVFTGVAGGLGSDVRVGDIVIAETLVQHDLDASPLFPRYEVPLYGRSHFDADPALSRRLRAAADALVQSLACAAAARVHHGLVLSGDRFVSSAAESARLCEAFPLAIAVEMEGAAVAQVCHDFGVPFAMLRTISDRADDEAHLDFNRFIENVASRYTVAAVLAFVSTPRC